MKFLLKFQRYLDLITMRASGELKTTASWIRSFVRSHPDYAGDSLVSDRVVSDLTLRANDLVHGKVREKSLLPESCADPCYCDD